MTIFFVTILQPENWDFFLFKSIGLLQMSNLTHCCRVGIEDQLAKSVFGWISDLLLHRQDVEDVFDGGRLRHDWDVLDGQVAGFIRHHYVQVIFYHLPLFSFFFKTFLLGDSPRLFRPTEGESGPSGSFGTFASRRFCVVRKWCGFGFSFVWLNWGLDFLDASKKRGWCCSRLLRVNLMAKCATSAPAPSRVC